MIDALSDGNASGSTAVRRASWGEQPTLLIEMLMVHGAEDLHDTMMIVDSFKTFGAV